MEIDLLMNHTKQGGVKRIGDFAKDAPHMRFEVMGDIIFIQMPNAILSRGTVQWDQKDFTPDSAMGGATLALYDGVTTSKDIPWMDAAGGAISQLGRKSISAIGAAAGVQDAADYVAHKAGKAVNPNKEMTFSGLGYRSFNFEFELVPTSEEQSYEINDFIEIMQLHAAPDFAGAAKTYFQYPAIWSVKFVPFEFLPAIMNSYLTDYAINYGGSGKIVSHVGAAPVQVNISMTFTEAELHTKDKIRAGYWG